MDDKVLYRIIPSSLKSDVFKRYKNALKEGEETLLAFLRKLEPRHFFSAAREKIVNCQVTGIYLEDGERGVYLMKNVTQWRGTGTEVGKLHKREDAAKFFNFLESGTEEGGDEYHKRAHEFVVYSMNNDSFNELLKNTGKGDLKRITDILRTYSAKNFDDERVKRWVKYADFVAVRWGTEFGPDRLFILKNNTNYELSLDEYGLCDAQATRDLIEKINEGKEPEPDFGESRQFHVWSEKVTLPPKELIQRNAKGEPSHFDCPSDVYRNHPCKVCGATQGCMHERTCQHENAIRIFNPKMDAELCSHVTLISGDYYCPDCRQKVDPLNTEFRTYDYAPAIPEPVLGSHWDNFNLKYAALD